MGATWLTVKVLREPPEMQTAEVRAEAGRCGEHEAMCSGKGLEASPRMCAFLVAGTQDAERALV